MVRKSCILQSSFFFLGQTNYYNIKNKKQFTERLNIAFQVPFKQTSNLYQGKLIGHCEKQCQQNNVISTVHSLLSVLEHGAPAETS